jgi:HPt (histidine-containing phosphotransfer) domain-containing protein
VSLLIRMTGFEVAASDVDAKAVAPGDLPPLPEIAGLELPTAVHRMSGMRSLYVRTAREFVKSMDPLLLELRQCLSSGDKKKGKMRLHTLKGNAGTLGAVELAEKAAHIEKLCSTEADMGELAPELDGLETMVQQAREKLNAAIALMDSKPTATLQKATPESGIANVEVAMGVLRRLTALARASDLEALQEFAESRESLAHLPAEDIDALELTLQNLDLDQAASLCERMLAGMEKS